MSGEKTLSPVQLAVIRDTAEDEARRFGPECQRHGSGTVLTLLDHAEEIEAVSTTRLKALEAAEPDAFRWRTVHPIVAAALTKLAVQAYGEGHHGDLVRCALCRAEAYGEPIVHASGCAVGLVTP